MALWLPKCGAARRFLSASPPRKGAVRMQRPQDTSISAVMDAADSPPPGCLGLTAHFRCPSSHQKRSAAVPLRWWMETPASLGTFLQGVLSKCLFVPHFRLCQCLMLNTNSEGQENATLQLRVSVDRPAKRKLKSWGPKTAWSPFSSNFHSSFLFTYADSIMAVTHGPLVNGTWKLPTRAVFFQKPIS